MTVTPLQAARRLVASAAFLGLASSVNAQSLAPQTSWVNDHGSQLVIQSIAPDGRLTGTYSGTAPSFKCRDIAFPLVGWVDGDRLSYTVRWKNADVDCGQITSWTGFARNGRIIVEWTLVYLDAGEGRQVLRRGFDQYKPK